MSDAPPSPLGLNCQRIRGSRGGNQLAKRRSERISSAGLRALLIANRATIGSQGKLALCEVIGDVKRLFEIGSLTELFLICKTRGDGIAKVRKDRQDSSRPQGRNF
jgi:hypothetical protein